MLLNHTITGIGKYVCITVAAFSGFVLSSCGGGGGGGGVAALNGGGSEALTSLLPEGIEVGNLLITTNGEMLKFQVLQLTLIGESGDAETYSVEGSVTFNTKEYNLSNQLVHKRPSTSRDGFDLQWEYSGDGNTIDVGKAALDIPKMHLRLKETQEGERQGEVQVANEGAQIFYNKDWSPISENISDYLNGSTIIIRY